MSDIIKGYGIQLKPLSKQYLEKVRQWRNHPEVARYMVSCRNITKEEQKAWFAKINVVDSCAHYLIFFREQAIGLIYIHSHDGQPLVNSRIIEPGMYLAYDSPHRGTMLAFSPALAMNDYCFGKLGCELMVAKVQSNNTAGRRFNEQLGYREMNKDNEYVHLELGYEDYKVARKSLSRIIRF